MAATIATTKLETLECAHCHMLFGAPQTWVTDRRRDHAGFCCPAGHRLSFSGESDLEKAQRLLQAAQAQAVHAQDQQHATELSLRAHKGQATRLRKRLAAGVCPCCTCTFADLARHMAGQHPDYVTAPPED